MKVLTKNFLIITLVVALFLMCIIPITSAHAQASDSENIAEPYALFVDVVLSIAGGNGEVWSIAQTRAAIFASGIRVVLELYSSDTYQESYTNMKLEKRVSIDNLRKGETLKASMPTNGEQKYWKGRMYYKADSSDWKYGVTETYLYDANGILVL